MIYQRGLRFRNEIYNDKFQMGINKSTRVILELVKPLEVYKQRFEEDSSTCDFVSKGI